MQANPLDVLGSSDASIEVKPSFWLVLKHLWLYGQQIWLRICLWKEVWPSDIRYFHPSKIKRLHPRLRLILRYPELFGITNNRRQVLKLHGHDLSSWKADYWFHLLGAYGVNLNIHPFRQNHRVLEVQVERHQVLEAAKGVSIAANQIRTVVQRSPEFEIPLGVAC